MKRILTLITALIALLSVPAVAVSLELLNDPATGGPGKFAVEEIRHEAKARGMTLGKDVQATRISLTTADTTRRIPFKAASGVFDSHDSDGNSAHSPTCSPSSADQVTR